MAKTFEDLDAFRQAVELTVLVYRITESFPPSERYGLASQLRRAASSISSHIAEGQGRLTPGEWRQMLSQARGSLYEVEAHSIVALRLGFLSDAQHAEIRASAKRVGILLAGLIAYVKRQEEKARLRRSATVTR